MNCKQKYFPKTLSNPIYLYERNTCHTNELKKRKYNKTSKIYWNLSYLQSDYIDLEIIFLEFASLILVGLLLYSIWSRLWLY
jgi:hypothetical protein